MPKNGSIIKSFNSFGALIVLIFLAFPPGVRSEFKYWNPKDTASIPKTLSDMGLYINIAAPIKVFAPKVYRFEVNSPLWSDDAKKMRWVLVPSNKKIEFDVNNDVWKYPDSTVFIKQFSIDTVSGDSTSRILWETRIMINKKEVPGSDTTRWDDAWYVATYKWNADQKDAKLVDLTMGMNDSLRVYPNGKNQPAKIKKWQFPSKDQCKQCHQVGSAASDSAHGRSILGFFTAQLNRPSVEVPTVNQLQYFFDKGLLNGVHPLDWNAESVPRWSSPTNKAASVDARARAYIAANCSGCHGRRGIRLGVVYGPVLNFDFHTMAPQMELRYKDIIVARGLDTLAPFFYNKNLDSLANPKHLDNLLIKPALVVPGYPEKSLLWQRLIRRNTADTGRKIFDRHPDQMPPLGSYEVDSIAKELIADWISTMTPLDQTPLSGIAYASRRDVLKSPSIAGHTLCLPLGMVEQAELKVSLTDILGHAIDLQKISKGRYAIPSSARPGVYVISIGKQNFIRHIF